MATKTTTKSTSKSTPTKMGTGISSRTFENSQGKTFSTHAAALASNTSMGTNPSAKSATVAPSNPIEKKGRVIGAPTDVPTPDSGIDVSQPSPEAVQANTNSQLTPTVPFDQASKALAQGMKGSSPQSIQSATEQMKQKYYGGFQQANASGVPAGSTAGAAAPIIQSTVPPAEPDTSALDTLLKEDKGWQELLQTKVDYFDPQEQKTSLMDTYNKLYKNSGLSQLDEEIIDAKTVIEGTEDDIRNEIEMAGGFGTDSQVQALSLSRNKVLLKNFNNLVALRESKENHLNTMLSLAEKDRAYADSQFDRALNFNMQMLDYRQKFIQNARDQYNKYTPQQLTAMLANNPRQLAFAEQILGVGQGGIAKLASAPLSESDQLDLELKRSSLKTDELQRANIRSQISERGKEIDSSIPTLSGKPQNASQSAANSYANRLKEANVSINNLGSKFTGKLSQLPAFNFMKSSDRQVYEQAQKNFITAVLRRESGASIADTEFDTARDIYFPKPGDSADVVKQKASTRNTVINNFYREANVPRPVTPGDIVEANGKQFKVGLDGETLEEI